jgi:uncharacterized protein
MSDMSLGDKISQDMKLAMKAGEKKRLGVIRLMRAAIKQREVDERITLDDEQIVISLDKMLKQRRDSIAAYEKAGRDELAEIEKYEIGVIQEYMPAQMSEAEISAVINDIIEQTEASSIKDMGKVMGILRPKVLGRADMGLVSKLVKKTLA